MRKLPSAFAALLLIAGACTGDDGGDGGAPDAGPGGMDAAETRTDSGPRADAAADASSVDGGEISEDASGPEDTGPPPDSGLGRLTTTLSGVVEDDAAERPLAGAIVEVSGAHTASATTGADGRFSFRVPQSSVVYLRARANGMMALASAVYVRRSPTDIDFGLESLASFDASLQPSGAARDPQKGFVWLGFESDGRNGGEGGTISLPHGLVLTANAQAEYVQGDTVPAGAAEKELLFTSVDIGTFTLTPVSPAGLRCVPEAPEVTSWPVFAETVTEIAIGCN